MGLLHRLIPASVFFCVGTLSFVSVLQGQTPPIPFTIQQFSAPPYICSITAGPDGAIWVGDSVLNLIGRMTTSGTLSQFPLPNPNSGPCSITSGPDGALWFTESAGRIGRITTAGAITEFALPTPGAGSPSGIFTGPDGNLWFFQPGFPSNNLTFQIDRITPSGIISEFPVDPSVATGISGFTSGPDGALWLTSSANNFRVTDRVLRMSTAGQVTNVFLLPSGFRFPGQILSGPDGALWFQVAGPSVSGTGWYYIGRMTVTGAFSSYFVQTHYPGGSAPLTLGPDHAFWIPVSTWPAIVRFTTSGVLTEYDQLPLAGGGVVGFSGLISGPGGLWFNSTGGFLGNLAFTPDVSAPVSHISPLPPTVSSPNFPVSWSALDQGWGVRDYNVFVSDDGAPFVQWLSHTSAATAYYPGMEGHTYGFFSVARDWAGNQENLKTAAEATTQVPSHVIGDINGDGRIDCTDVSLLKASLGKRTGQPGFDPRADLNGDGVVDIRDLMLVTQKLIPGTTCP